MAPGTALAAAIDRQRGHLLHWVPVCLGLGIALYFALPLEPGPLRLGLAFGLCLACAALMPLAPDQARPLLLALLLIGAGFALAGARAHLQAAPVLDFRYYGPIEGRVIEIDRSRSDMMRLTLDRVVLARMDPSRTPDRVRISLHGLQGFLDPEPGQTVILTGHLSAPSQPPEPGGFDFQRMAWFERLGAVGYTRTPVLLLAPPQRDGLALAVHRLRMTLSAAMQAALPGQTGAFAAAVTTGDRAGLDKATLEAMRDTNMAHLLAISGLHMGLLAGVVFAGARVGLALVPPLALRLPGKKIGAVIAILAAAGYLLLSGGAVSAQRAFIMVAVMLCAVLIDERALTLRAVALAAVVILVWRPEALLGAGFQMSFAATSALVCAFAALRGRDRQAVPAWLRPVLAVLISSAVAGLATAPFGAAHFNRSASYGLLANLMSVPVMGSVVIPAAVLAVCLAPVGLQGPALWVMGKGIDWILWVAHSFAALPGAVRHIPQPDPVVLPMIVMGALFVMLWQGRGRLAGAVPILAALWLWTQTERPDLLIAETGGLIGSLTEAGRALNKPRGDGYAAQSWLENDGDGATQEQAAARPGTSPAELSGLLVHQAGGRGARADPCAGADVAVTALDIAQAPCLLLTPDRLARTGALALWARPDGPVVATTRDRIGQRMWNSREVRRWIDRQGNRPDPVKPALALTDTLRGLAVPEPESFRLSERGAAPAFARQTSGMAGNPLVSE
jgi:competence protein ComEC